MVSRSLTALSMSRTPSVSEKRALASLFFNGGCQSLTMSPTSLTTSVSIVRAQVSVLRIAVSARQALLFSDTRRFHILEGKPGEALSDGEFVSDLRCPLRHIPSVCGGGVQARRSDSQ